MLITTKDLQKIEATVGHSCLAGVAWNERGPSIRITADLEGKTYGFEKLFSLHELINTLEPEMVRSLERFAKEVKLVLDKALSEEGRLT